MMVQEETPAIWYDDSSIDDRIHTVTKQDIQGPGEYRWKISYSKDMHILKQTDVEQTSNHTDVWSSGCQLLQEVFNTCLIW